MTSHNDQIRALIAEIDALLGSSPGLLWGLSGDRTRHRAALEHLRTYLSASQTNARKARIHNLPPTAEPSLDGKLVPADPAKLGEERGGEHLLDQLSQDLTQLRHSLLAPLQAEVEQLQAQRHALSQEVQLLTQQRQLANAASGQEQLLRDFMESLMVRLQERLVVQVAEVLQQSVTPLRASAATATALPAADQQQIEQLQDRANALLSNLDSTLQVFSKTLEQNVQGYQQSLAQGLERMHSLGHQGEMMVSSLVDRLAEQMEARTAVYLQAPQLRTSASTMSPLPGSADPLRLPGQVDLEMGLGGAMANPTSGEIAPERSTQAVVSGFGLAARDVAAQTQTSTSSAGIARRRVMAAQASDRAETAISDRDLDISGLNWSNTGLSSGRSSGLASGLSSRSTSLEDFYASLETSPSGSPWPAPVEQAPQDESVRSLGAATGASSHATHGAAVHNSPVSGRYQKLEDALFDGIPEGGFPQVLHRSQANLLQESLPDLADRRFDDFAAFETSRRAAPSHSGAEGDRQDSLVALYGDPSYWRNSATAAAPAKKKRFSEADAASSDRLGATELGNPGPGELRGWSLGLDLDATGLGALLFNQLTGQSYPLYWQPLAPDWNSPDSSPVRHWRLPGVVHLSPSLEDRDWNIDQAQIELPQPGQPLAQGLLLCDLSLALDLGLPYVTVEEHSLEPQLNWYFRPIRSQQRLSAPPSLALGTILRSLTGLLSHLTQPPGDQPSAWRCGATGLDPERVYHILANLEGVVVNSPTHCSEAYRFNLREAILAAGLALRPEQIAFLETPIAALLAEFHPHHSPRFERSQWQGGTLVIHTTETTTELAVVCLPSSLHNLSREDIRLRSLAYGDRAYRQDIACQLLYPYIPEEQIDLDLAILPLPGEADPAVRSQLQRVLYQSPAGAMLIEAANQLNRVLQRQERLTFEFGSHRCSFSQTALDTKVTQPFILRLNREVNHLLSEAGLVGETIAQVICTGEETTRPAIVQWLGQKLPQARIVGDWPEAVGPGPVGLAPASATGEATGEAASGDSSAILGRDRPPYASHRLAYGLACLPLYSQVLDRKGQQYSSYFVLLEMLRCLPEEALTVAEIFNHLEGRGINSQACQDQVEQILAGGLPAGLIPQANVDQWTLASRQNLDYQVLQEPLFRQLSDQSFQIDLAQRDRLLQYWQQVTAHSHQSLEEPYSLQVGLSLSDQWA